MSNLVLFKKSQFGNVKCDLWKSKDDEILFTREQIGTALEYSNPQKAIDNIHSRYKDRLDKFSVTLKVRGTDGKNYETCLYTSKGLYEICRWSRQPKADAFIDWAWEVVEKERKTLSEIRTPEWQQTRLNNKSQNALFAQTIKSFQDYAKQQGSNNAERYFKHFQNLANTSLDIENGLRNYTDMNVLSAQTVVFNIIKTTLNEEMAKGTYYKTVYKIAKERLEMFTPYFKPQLARISEG